MRSGVVNAGAPFDLRATASAASSTYAGIVRLAAQAQADSAPFVRMADRYAIGFVPLTLLVAGLAWLASGDAVNAVAVLVVATPCPLILAAPVALVGGLSQAARRGAVVKGGSALERLASGKVLLFDKTGTLTVGRPTVETVVAAPGRDGDEVLRLAASLDQASPHVIATAVVAAATRRGLPLVTPLDVVEKHGFGVSGRVAGHPVAVGKSAWLAPGPRRRGCGVAPAFGLGRFDPGARQHRRRAGRRAAAGGPAACRCAEDHPGSARGRRTPDRDGHR